MSTIKPGLVYKHEGQSAPTWCVVLSVTDTEITSVFVNLAGRYLVESWLPKDFEWLYAKSTPMAEIGGLEE